MAIKAISDEFICPLTQELMVEPVIADDGNTYEAHELDIYLKGGKDVSPMDNLTKISSKPIPNRALKRSIEMVVDMGEVDEGLIVDYKKRKLVVAKRVDERLKEAIALYDAGNVKESADMGYAKAQGEYAVDLYKGGMLRQAVIMARMAINGGDANGYYVLGNAYFNGTSQIAISNSTAFEYYEKAAAKGHSRSIYRVGYMYIYGIGVERNVDKAIEWWDKDSYTKEDKWSMYHLGYYYRHVTYEWTKAYDYFNEAIRQHDHVASMREKALMILNDDFDTPIWSNFDDHLDQLLMAWVLMGNAAKQGDKIAIKNMKKHISSVSRSKFIEL